MKSEVKRFFESEVRKTNRVLKLFPAHLLSRIQEDIRNEFSKIQKEKTKEAIGVAFSDPIIFRISLIIRTPPEDLTLRLKVYRISHPLNDHRYLIRVLESEGVQISPILRTFLFHLKEDFIECYMVDSQKQHGRAGLITELREAFLQVSEEEDGTHRIEYDHWPFARLVKKANFKQRQIDCHFHLLKEPTKYDFWNILDWLSIWAIQDNRLLRKDNEVFISVYDWNGKLLNASGEPFPLPLDGHIETEKLLGRYKPLIKKTAVKDILSKRGYLEDTEQEIREAFIRSAFEYDPSKGPPMGYLKTIAKDSLRDFKKEIFGWNYKEKTFPWFNMESLDQERKDRTSKMEGLRAQPKSDSALLDDSIKELLDRGNLDEINRIIVLNYRKSDPEIVKIIKQKMKKPIERAAVQRRRTKHIKPLLLEILEDKRAIREDETRRGQMDPRKAVSLKTNDFWREENETRGQIDSRKDPESGESDPNPEENLKM